MQHKVYIPMPIDTADVEIGQDILELAELLARNTHEVWAANKIREGWKYGPVLDRDARTHPSLVAYEELPESEKDYDRRTSQETLKVLIRLGYQIERA